MNKLLTTLAAASAIFVAQPALAVSITNVAASGSNTATPFETSASQISVDFDLFDAAPTTIDFGVDAGDNSAYFFDSAVNIFAGAGFSFLKLSLTNGATFDLGSVMAAFSTASASLNGAGNVATINFAPKEYVFSQLGSLSDTNGDFVINLNGLGAGDGFQLVVAGGPVPEPTTWAMMIAGFGLAGFAMRRRQGTLLAA